MSKTTRKYNKTIAFSSECNVDGNNSPIKIITELTANCIQGRYEDLILSLFTRLVEQLKYKQHMSLDELNYITQLITFDFGYDYVLHLDDIKIFEFMDRHSLLLYYTAVVVVDYISKHHFLVGYTIIGNNVEFVFDIAE